MKARSIISRGEALQILKNDLRKRALEKHAAELKDAGPDQRQEILQAIERDMEKEVRWRAQRPEPDNLIH